MSHLKTKRPGTGRTMMLLFAIGFITGCESPFPPETLVDRLRLLAIRAEPPEAFLTDTVHLDALVADLQDEDRKLEVTWAVCFFEFENSASDILCPGPDSYLLAGNQLETDFSLPAWIDWLKENGVDPESILNQIDTDQLPWILIGFRLETDGLTIRAVKRLKLHLDEQQPANSNPMLEGILVNGKQLDQPEPSLQIGNTYDLQPLVSEESREWYIPGDQDQTRQEDHLFSWFSTCGTFSDRRTIADVDNQGNWLQNNQWKLGSKPAGDLCMLWIVLRDGRYGVDWAAYNFQLNAS